MAATPGPETKRYCIADLDEFPDDGRLRELAVGQIVVWDGTTWRHGSVIALLTIIIGSFVRERRLGQLVDADALVKIQSSEHDARGGDVTFYRRDRFPANLDAPATDVVPDFVVEVLSPSDRAAMVEAKIDDWLRAGVRLLWYVNARSGVTMVYRAGEVRRVHPDQELDGGEVLPGLTLRMADVLAELAEQGGRE
jgi:Uma2 family endonuclease